MVPGIDGRILESARGDKAMALEVLGTDRKYRFLQKMEISILATG